MKSKRGTVWINLGLLLLAAALFLTVYNRMASYEAGETSRQVIEQLCETLPTESAAETEAPAIPEYLLDAGREMPVQTIGGKDYIVVNEGRRGWQSGHQAQQPVCADKAHNPKRIFFDRKVTAISENEQQLS